MFDGFEGYITPSRDALLQCLRSGLVALDANVLLNLYRYTADARDDFLAVLDRLATQLFVPHQALEEFWRNRETVLRDARDTKKASKELEDHREKAQQAVRAWANRVSLPADEADLLQAQIGDGFSTVLGTIRRYDDRSADAAARDTTKDEVLGRLATILADRIGVPFSVEGHAAAVKEGLRRVEQGVPPGFKDKGKDAEAAAGDYLVWKQILDEAQRLSSPAMLVTGDLKEDWWRTVQGERRGPRLELVRELHEAAGVTLYMVRPAQLLELARAGLSVSVRDTTLDVATRVEEQLSVSASGHGGWSMRTIAVVLDHLQREAPDLSAVIAAAARDEEGFVSRSAVYEIAGFSEERSLRGFTRPVNRLARNLKRLGELTEDAVEIVRAVYAGGVQASGFLIHPSVLSLVSDYYDEPEPDEEVIG